MENGELNRCKKSSSLISKVSIVAVLRWNIREAMLAILLSTLAMEREASKGGCFINMDLHGQSTSEPTSNRRMGGAEFVGPADGWCVVAPCCHMDVPQDCEVFQQYKVVEEHAGHFEIRVGNVSHWVVEQDNGLVDVS